MSIAAPSRPLNNNRRGPQLIDIEKLRADLDKLRPDLEKVLDGTGISPDRIIRSVLTEVRLEIRLLECSPESILGCAVQAAQLGLVPGQVLGQCYLAATGKQGNRRATLRTYYRGLIILVMRAGVVARVDAQMVYENDEFEHEFGSKPFLRHKRTLGERGKPLCVYAILYYRNGAPPAFELMSVNEIEAIRNEYSNASEASPWNSEVTRDEMFRKTPLRRLLKYQPQLGSAQQLAIMDEYADAGIDTGAESALRGEWQPEKPAADGAPEGDPEPPATEPAPAELPPPPPPLPPTELHPLPRAGDAAKANPAKPEVAKPDPVRERELRTRARKLYPLIPSDEKSRALVLAAAGVREFKELAVADSAALERFNRSCEGMIPPDRLPR